MPSDNELDEFTRAAAEVEPPKHWGTLKADGFRRGRDAAVRSMREDLGLEPLEEAGQS